LKDQFVVSFVTLIAHIITLISEIKILKLNSHSLCEAKRERSAVAIPAHPTYLFSSLKEQFVVYFASLIAHIIY